MALPAEHGGWGLLLEPIVLALLVAPSLPGLLIATGATAAFLMRHPLKLAARDWLQRRRYPRSRVCEMLAATYGAAAFLAFAGAWRMTGVLPFVALVIALKLAAVQFFYDVRNRGRLPIPEFFGAVAAAPIAAAIALAGGRTVLMAAALSTLAITRSIPAVLYVRAALRNERRAWMLIAHAAAVAVAAFISWIAALAMAILFVRAVVPVGGVRAQTIGFREVGWGALTVLLIAISYYI
ncbi:MAG TPA: YwiC-like family protein [Thermoanaerobaculia bacterium]|nr:YwiC-like family protein [Thermoanaerobaculia bacterium]